jgi:hypothetical protein
MGIQSLIDLIQTGDPVSPGVANRAPQELSANITYLWNLIQAASLGSTVYARQVPVEAAAATGMAVYFEGATQQFQRALAQLATDQASGIVYTSKTSEVWGVVATKYSATLADVLLFGYAAVDISAALGLPAGSSVPEGAYYLSSVTAGGLVKARPPVSVPVLRSDGQGKVYVTPQFVDVLDAHKHYCFNLMAYPAGTTSPPAAGHPHVITNPVPTQRGWLPISSFAPGTYPEGAKFGYNLAAETALSGCWPPVPLSNVYLEWQRTNSQAAGYTGVDTGVNGICHVTATGIWWMTNCLDSVPWPWDLNTASPGRYESDYYASEAAECPPEIFPRLRLWFTKLNLADDTGLVLSLTSRDNRVKIYCAGTANSGSTGNLELDLNLSFMNGAANTAGSQVIKNFDGVQTFNSGPVVEGIIPQSANIIATSNVPTQSVGGKTMYQGQVSLTVLPETTAELKCLLVRMAGTVEEEYPVPYIGLPSDSPSSYIAQFEVPMNAGANLSFTPCFRFYAPSTGTYPAISLSYLDIPLPGSSPIAVPTAYTALETLPTVSVTAGTCFEVYADTITVNGGDLVCIQVSRAAPDGYADDVGVLQQVGLLTLG